MTCQQYEAELVDLARGTPADDAAEMSVRDHLDTCAVCAARFERECRLTAGLRALTEATPVPANDIAERRLMEAFAAACPPSRRSGGQRVLPARRTGQRAVGVSDSRWLAAAACVLFFLGLWAAVQWRGRTLAPAGAGAPVQTALRASAEQPRPIGRMDSPVRAPVPLAADTRRAPAPRAVRAALRNELPQDTDRLAGFIPLPAADGLPGFDSGMIVRVALPTASLPAFGLAIAPEAPRTVNADVLVGQDGQARAIRLVSLAGGSRREPR
jgi:hypothetical protein